MAKWFIASRRRTSQLRSFGPFDDWQTWHTNAADDANHDYLSMGLNRDLPPHHLEGFVDVIPSEATAITRSQNINQSSRNQEHMYYCKTDLHTSGHASRQFIDSPSYASTACQSPSDDGAKPQVGYYFSNSEGATLQSASHSRLLGEAGATYDEQHDPWSGVPVAAGGHTKHYRASSYFGTPPDTRHSAHSSSMPTSGSAVDQPSQSRTEPPMTTSSGESRPRRQSPRFSGDEYTATWVRGEGIDRAGWCGLCSSWHKLKDSAYWYHMHYSHGISCATGRPFNEPEAWRQAQGAVGVEALCGGCSQWVYVGRRERWHTPYYRHAYRCLTKNKPTADRPRIIGKAVSPRKPHMKHLRSL